MAGQPEVKMSGNVEVTTRMGAAYLSVGKIAVYVHHVWAVPLFCQNNHHCGSVYSLNPKASYSPSCVHITAV